MRVRARVRVGIIFPLNGVRMRVRARVRVRVRVGIIFPLGEIRNVKDTPPIGGGHPIIGGVIYVDTLSTKQFWDYDQG